MSKTKDCPHCGNIMELWRGIWLCKNLKGCAYSEAAEDGRANDPEVIAVIRARQRLRHTFRDSLHSSF